MVVTNFHEASVGLQMMWIGLPVFAVCLVIFALSLRRFIRLMKMPLIEEIVLVEGATASLDAGEYEVWMKWPRDWFRHRDRFRAVVYLRSDETGAKVELGKIWMPAVQIRSLNWSNMAIGRMTVISKGPHHVVIDDPIGLNPEARLIFRERFFSVSVLLLMPLMLLSFSFGIMGLAIGFLF